MEETENSVGGKFNQLENRANVAARKREWMVGTNAQERINKLWIKLLLWEIKMCIEGPAGMVHCYSGD